MASGQGGLWFVTNVETSETVKVVEGGRSSEDTGGGFGSSAVEAVRKSLTQRVQISAEDLKEQISHLTAILSDVFDQASHETALRLDEVELSIEVSSGGQVSILGSGGKLEGRGGIKLSFKRKAEQA